MLFDPVTYHAALEAMDMYAKTKVDSGLVCSHCYRKILGKVYRIENDFLDAFCYSMRFSIGYERTKEREPDSTPLDEWGD